VSQLVSRKVSLGHFGSRSDAVGLLFRRQTRRGPLQFRLAPLLVFLCDGFAGRAGGLLEPLALIDKLANEELRDFAVALRTINSHYLPPFLDCFLVLPLGRPPSLPHSLSCFAECFAARVLPPIAPVLRK
jgi:hypothetical protein